MKKKLLKSALTAMAGIGLLAGSAMTATLGPADWDGDKIETFLLSSTFPGGGTMLGAPYTFTGQWIYTAIGFESGNINAVRNFYLTTAGPGNFATGAAFSTANTSNFGQFATVDFSQTNLYFADSDGGYNVALNPYVGTATNGFKIFGLVQNSGMLTYLSHQIYLQKGDLIVGFNDNQRNSDGDYDDMIAAMRPVPEPATLLLFGTGLAGLAGFGRRKRS